MQLLLPPSGIARATRVFMIYVYVTNKYKSIFVVVVVVVVLDLGKIEKYTV